MRPPFWNMAAPREKTDGTPAGSAHQGLSNRDMGSDLNSSKSCIEKSNGAPSLPSSAMCPNSGLPPHMGYRRTQDKLYNDFCGPISPVTLDLQHVGLSARTMGSMNQNRVARIHLGPMMDPGQVWSFLLLAVLSLGNSSETNKQKKDTAAFEIYKKLFEVKRKDQINALNNLIELNDVNQQYKIIDIMLKGLFKVLEDSRLVLIAAGVQPDGPFPADEKIKDAYSHTVENSAFFGDVVLRFPKIVHHYFDRNSNWNNLIRWGIGFCNLSGIFDEGPHSQLLGLMSQELGISEKSPDYRNPFRTENMEFLPNTDAFQKALKEEEKRRRKEEKRKEIRKGPRITRSRSEL
ncbi:unnamed protein product [Ranitomeya imitator]|uniref:Coiled-coil domain-containing protein 134 n=2 Tax=Ranitomeya imitator TaxID=111125 RepID=A0ABN9LLV6_9NEOB|nr:unnamed protein product [Ranitomeya imitator]